LYTESHPGFTGRVTVPLLWDDSNSLIVSNDSALIMRALDRIDQRRFSLVPGHLVDRIDSLNAYIHTGLANAVYRAGLAQAQSAHDEAIADVFATLAALEKRLSRSRYLLGDAMCEADLRLFATLVRFDAVYVTHFRCTRHRLTDYPNLWAYARDIYAWPGVYATVSFDAILDGYYRNDGWHNPHGIIPERPAADWTIPSGRSRVGPACLWTADGQLLSAPIEDDQ
ncbi:MAG: glutathione-dependent reductase, partial [Granulosicoccus sp.]|nr:glutathione-dependent reductase [Granulosicoccus sp.]